MITEDIKKKIRGIVGAENALDSDLDRFGYSYDASFVPLLPAKKPDLVVRPATTEEVSRIMAVAYEHAIPVTPRGAASGRTGGSIPLQGGISLSLDRMTKIIELDVNNMMVWAEAGVRTIDLYNDCAAKGLFYPPDPASWKFSTIGGNVAENAGGMRAVKYGVTSNYVMGLEVVLADGTVLRTGGKAIKNVTGYDLTSLFTGSEGTLGIITKVLVRLIPMPKKRGTLQVMFRTLDDGCADDPPDAAGGPRAGGGRDHGPVLPRGRGKAPQDGARSGDRRLHHHRNRRRGRRGPPGAGEANRSRSPEVRRRTSSASPGRSRSPTICGPSGGASAPPSPPCARTASARTSRSRATPSPRWCAASGPSPRSTDFTIAVYGHAGDGNIHPSILCDLSKPGEEERVHQAVDEIFAAALAVGGTLSGEHGIGITKRPYIASALGEAGVKTLKAVKQALDPKGILNPGKIW